MAENEAKLEIVSRDGEGRSNPNPIFTLLQKVPFFNFPPLKRDAPKPEAVVVSEQPTGTVGDYEEKETKPVAVMFPHTRPEMLSLKLEVDESEQNTNPIVLWQVYAIGGFFILKWALARWKERMAKKRSSDEEPSPADD